MESFALALALVVLASGNHDPAKEADEHPYIVSIHRNSAKRNFICAGSLIATTWVLTTAHCLTKLASKIRYGDMITINNGTYSNILQRIHHRNSRSFHFELARKRLTPKANNIGLALVEEVPVKQVAVLSGIDYITLRGHEVTNFEFGFLPVFKARIYQSNKNRLKDLVKKQHPWLKNIKEKDGNDSMGPFPPEIKVLRTSVGVVTTCENRGLPGPNMCVASKCFDFSAEDPRVTFIAPDYGAPLLHDNKVVGVTSEVESYYSKYTPVSPYLDWIRQYMEQESTLC